MAKKKLKNYTWLIVAAIVVLAVIVLSSGESGVLAKYYAAAKITPVPAPAGQPDLVPEIKYEYTPTINGYSACTIIRNAGRGTVTVPFKNEIGQIDPTTGNIKLLGTCTGPDGSAMTVVRTAASKLRFNPTTLAPNEELECGCYGLQASTQYSVTVLADAGNAITESSETNNELRVGKF